MRRLVGVVLAVSALLGVIGMAAPAAAETAQQCHATLNQYRAKAGLTKASSSSIPALGVAAARHAAYRVNVDPGDSILLTSLQAARLTALFAIDEHVEVEATWGIYQRMIAAYRHPNPAAGRELMVKLIESLSAGVPRPLVEIAKLGRT